MDEQTDIKCRINPDISVKTINFIKYQFEIVRFDYTQKIKKNKDIERIVDFIQEKGFEEKY